MKPKQYLNGETNNMTHYKNMKLFYKNLITHRITIKIFIFELDALLQTYTTQ